VGICTVEPKDKKELGTRVGHRLVRDYGKRRFYTPQQVRSAVHAESFPMDWACWGYALFCTPEDFAAVHRTLGEACDFAAMKADMTSAVTDGASGSWFDLDLSWLDWPDIDLSSVFDLFDVFG
jgi:hypothetical protein